MTIGEIVIALLVMGVCLWGLQKLPWFDHDTKTVIRVLVVVAAVLWFLSHLGGATHGCWNQRVVP